MLICRRSCIYIQRKAKKKKKRIRPPAPILKFSMTRIQVLFFKALYEFHVCAMENGHRVASKASISIGQPSLLFIAT